MPDMADTRIAEAVAALRRFVAEHGSIPTAESWTEATMRLSEKTIRRRFGSFRKGDPACRADLILGRTRGPELAMPDSRSLLGARIPYPTARPSRSAPSVAE